MSFLNYPNFLVFSVYNSGIEILPDKHAVFDKMSATLASNSIANLKKIALPKFEKNQYRRQFPFKFGANFPKISGTEMFWENHRARF